MKQSRESKDFWVVEPIHLDQEECYISDIVVSDHKGNRRIIDARQIYWNYPQPSRVREVWFNGEQGVV